MLLKNILNLPITKNLIFQGDTGGPLNCPIGPGGSYQVAGIASFGIVDCPPDKPSGYARISTYRSWIDSNID